MFALNESKIMLANEMLIYVKNTKTNRKSHEYQNKKEWIQNICKNIIQIDSRYHKSFIEYTKFKQISKHNDF